MDNAVVQGDRCRVFIKRCNTCAAGAEVVAISIEKLKHTWPSKEDSGFNGTAAIVEFFRRHAKP